MFIAFASVVVDPRKMRDIRSMVATIGYERATLANFIATLKCCDVQILVDVRERAQSRRPGFSKTSLRNALEDAGIKYIHMPELGDPKPGREAARQGNLTLFRQIFESVLVSDEAKFALERLKELSSISSICLMCFERDQLTCHRKIVSDRLEQMTGQKARHLGVVDDAGNKAKTRRMSYSDQGATTSV